MSGNVSVSVIICTYNPSEQIFSKCLQSISAAKALSGVHEILIVDNNSTIPLNDFPYIQKFLQENSDARLLKETRQGLTHARLRGIREASGDLLVFVDDDNFLSTSYFAQAKETARNYPFIGAFSGQVDLAYDKQPPQWTKRYWGMLTYRPLSKDLWSNVPFDTDTMPNGAGLCVTRDTALHYLGLYEAGKRNFVLDRSQQSLLSGGDNDLAMCACDIGKGMGLFKGLTVTHYMTENRFSISYLEKLAYGIYYSYAILLFMREGTIKDARYIQRLKNLVRMNLMNRNDRRIFRATRMGLKDAAKYLRSLKEEQR